MGSWGCVLCFVSAVAIADHLHSFGMINWLFAIPGIKLMDSFGRRYVFPYYFASILTAPHSNLLLSTYPMMSVCLLMTGFAFWIPEGTVRIAVILLGIYLLCVHLGEQDACC